MDQCAACGAANRPGRRFCAQCGAPLELVCAACGTANDADDRFCGGCGAPLTPAAVARSLPVPDDNRANVAERRVCTVLFTDLVGFTPLAESRDPEEVREFLSRYFDAARTVIGRYGGVVEKFIGDAVMAVWGTPVAVEDDAERAVRAGLDLVAAVSVLGEEVGVAGLRARVGVVTGEIAVTVGLVGEGLAGDAINTAARVQTVAAPGEVWVDDATHRLAAAAIGFVDTGEHALKGKSEPMRLWAATRVVSGRGGSQRIDGLEAPLLGRDAELRTIKELLHATIERRSPRLVVVSGPAGVGKSRLSWEFEKYVDGVADTMWWHRGRCLSYGDGVAFWALAEVVRQRFAIADEDPPEVASDKLRIGLDTYLPDPEERRYIAVRLARLLGVPVEGDPGTALGREELFAGWRLFFERLAAINPVVVVIEDAQHADVGLLDFLDHLADWARDVPIFMLVLTRPELAQLRPGWGIGRNRTVLTLDPLDSGSMDAVVDALVPHMSTEVRTAIAAQAQGIPLFAVETIRSLIDRDIVVPHDGVYQLVGDIGELTVPDSLRGLLGARLDALDDKLRSLVADAAVLGTTFPVDALVAVSGLDEPDVRACLAELLRRQVFEVSADPLSPQRGNYGFTHNLLRQVAYETMSRRDRRSRHLAVAAHLRATFPSDAEEVIDVVAHHYLDALAAVPGDADAAEVRAEAIAALVRAAERALRSGAPLAAAQNYATAATLTTESGRADALTSAAALEEQAAFAFVIAGDVRALDLADRAAQRYRDLGQRRAAARAAAISGQALLSVRRHSEARERLTAALDVLRAEPDEDTVTALSALTSVEAHTGGRDAERLSAEALILGQALDVDPARRATLFINRGIALHFLNRYDEAAAHIEYSVRLAEQCQDSLVLGRALLNLATGILANDPPAAAAAARTGCEHCRRAGAEIMLSTAVNNLIDALILTGEWDEAARVLREAVVDDGLGDESDVIHMQLVLAAFRGDLATVRRLEPTARFSAEDIQDRASSDAVKALVAMAEDRLADALSHGRAVVAASDTLGVRHELLIRSWPTAARAASSLGDTKAVEELVAALDAHPAGHIPPLLRIERDLAVVLASTDADAGERLREAVAALRRFGSPYHLAHGLLDQAEFVQRAGDTASAEPLVAEAVEIGERLQAAPLLRRAQALQRTERAVAAHG